MRNYLGRYIPSLFAIAIVFIFFDGFLSYYNLANLNNDQEWVSHTHEVISELEAVSADVRVAESAQRGFLLTGDNTYLSSYYLAPSAITRHIKHLKDLTKNDALQKKQLTTLDSLVKKRIDALQKGIDLYNERGFEVAQQYLLKGEGNDIIREIATIIAGLESNERSFLRFSAQKSQTSIRTTYASITFAMVLDLILIVVAFILVRRELAHRYQQDLRKNEFISIASHELRTPITSMGVFAHVLEKRLETTHDAKAKNYIQKIRDQIAKQANLINDLLDISKIQSGHIEFHKEVFDMNKLVRETVEVVQTTTNTHKIVIKGRAKQKVYADRERVAQVITNFLSNAIKYSPSAKKVIISVEDFHKSIRVNVQDFGIGIALKDQRKIFNRFYRVEQNNKTMPGLGIGLYIVQEIIYRQGGSISVKSQEEKGSIFSFTLPVRNSK